MGRFTRRPSPDAYAAIAEAAARQTMRYVALKSEAQLDVQTQHQVRDQLARAMAARAAGAVARQYGGGRPGGQDGAHRLGAAARRARLGAGGRGCLILVRPTRTRRPSDVCER